MEKIQVSDKRFKLYMTETEIQTIIERLASDISRDFRDRNPILCPILTGSFIFAADLIRRLDFDAPVSFVRYSSYSGTSSTGQVIESLGFPASCQGRHVILIEDIIDTGISMQFVLERLQLLNPASITICTFLFKPGCFKKNYKIDYIGKEIPDDFIVGYGLDYNGLGRKYPDIYTIDNQ